jgi:ATP-dependent RNA helicase DDX54/DBP10
MTFITCLPNSIVATPGRLLHVLVEMELKLASVEYVVFDEADRLFEMGFSEQLREILFKLPESRSIFRNFSPIKCRWTA